MSRQGWMTLHWSVVALGNFGGFAVFAGTDILGLKLLYAGTTLGAVLLAARSYLR